MSLEEPGPDEVIALRFEDASVGEELASWCEGGLVGESITVPLADGGVGVAHVGDWLVRDAHGCFAVVDPRDFAVRFAPPES